MPIYDYRCKSDECDHEWSVLKDLDDSDEIEVCEKCGTEGRKVIGKVPVHRRLDWGAKGSW